MNDIIAAILIVVGSFLSLVAGIGIVRMPDLFTRMHASTKASSLGLGLTLAGVAVHFGAVAVTTRAVAIVFFLFLTLPVGAHLLGRAAYLSGVPLWEGTVVDELRPHTESRESLSHPVEEDPTDGGG